MHIRNWAFFKTIYQLTATILLSNASSFTQSIEVVEFAEHRLQLDMAWQIQRKLKFSHLRVDWHSLSWSIANLGDKIRVRTTITASRSLCSSRLALCFSLCPLGHFSSSIHLTGSNWYRKCTVLRISSRLRTTIRSPGLITSREIQTAVPLIWLCPWSCTSMSSSKAPRLWPTNKRWRYSFVGFVRDSGVSELHLRYLETTSTLESTADGFLHSLKTNRRRFLRNS